MKSLYALAQRHFTVAIEVLKRVKVPESVASDLSVEPFSYLRADGFALTLYGSKDDITRYAFTIGASEVMLYSGNALHNFEAGRPTTAIRQSCRDANELVAHLSSTFRILGAGRTASFNRYLAEKKAALRRAG